MRNCKKNERNMMYSLYDDKVPILDENGNDTFEYTIGYHAPVAFKGSLSTGKSFSGSSVFGTSADYERMICTTDMTLPIDENSIIWVKNTPTYFENGNVDPKSADYKVSASVLDGLNSLRIAVESVPKTYTSNSSNDVETPVNEDAGNAEDDF